MVHITELVKMVRSWLRRSGIYLALRMRMANSVDADQTAPREKKRGGYLILGPYNGAG